MYLYLHILSSPIAYPVIFGCTSGSPESFQALVPGAGAFEAFGTEVFVFKSSQGPQGYCLTVIVGHCPTVLLVLHVLLLFGLK